MRNPSSLSFRLLSLTAAVLSLGGGAVAASFDDPQVENFEEWAHLHNDYAVPHVHGLPNPAARGALPKEVTALEAATPRAKCGPGSQPEPGRQGRAPLADYESGRAEKPYTCNAELVSHYGNTGGFAVHRYIDKNGHECAIFDSTLLFGRDIPRRNEPGTWVLDMSDPAKPVRTAILQTPAMNSPHESLRLNQKRGLLAANMGTAATYPGFVDIYDLSEDCREPVLRSSVPLALAGHEGAFSPDGRTYWAATTAAPGVTAIDVTNPDSPSVVWRSQEYASHGISISPDGKRAYLSEVADFATTTSMGAGGFTILDVSEIQKRVSPLPTVTEVGSVTWPEVSIPQNSVPVTIDGRDYAIQFDEYDSNVWSDDRTDTVGGVHVIDLTNETRPKIVSRIRLEVHQQEARQTDQWSDPGADSGGQGYAAHYCSVPRTVDPKILACSMIASGLRVFDIRDPERPREIAYFNKPALGDQPSIEGAYAMSAPAFAPERGEIWYSDTNSGFFNVRLTNSARRLLKD